MTSANIMICVPNVFCMSKDDFQKFISQKNICVICISSHIVVPHFFVKKKNCCFSCFPNTKSTVVVCWCYTSLEMLTISFWTFLGIYSSKKKLFWIIFYENLKKKPMILTKMSHFMHNSLFKIMFVEKLNPYFFSVWYITSYKC